jgi:hypothetical protein
MYLLAICTSFENSVQFICPFIDWVIFWVLYIIWILTHYLVDSCKNFLPFCRLSPHSDNYFFCCAEAFEFKAKALSILAVISWAIWVLFGHFLCLRLEVFSSCSFKVSGPTLKSLNILTWFLYSAETGIQFQSSVCGKLVFPALFTEEAVFSLMFSGTFIESQMAINVQIYC